jgi:Icc-related predicted phosphoesterase
MRVAALYDIHGNLPALESMLEELQHFTVDRIIVGGDVLSGPMQVECIERLRVCPCQ